MGLEVWAWDVFANNRDSKSDWPELRLMTSTGLPASNAPGNEQAREPKGNEVSRLQ